MILSPQSRDLQRLLAKVERDTQTGCWNWTASRVPAGYAQFRLHGRRDYGHRAAYELLVGPIPAGLQLDHLCRNRGCVNPDHLEPVTNRVNGLRGVSPCAVNAAKTHCVNGHPFDAQHTYFRKDRPGRRQCRTCSNNARQAKRLAEKGVA